MIVKKTTYKVLVKEYNEEPREIEITTDRGIEWSMDQYGRNRHVESWRVVEVIEKKDNLLLG